jgi:hypothetical protein
MFHHNTPCFSGVHGEKFRLIMMHMSNLHGSVSPAPFALELNPYKLKTRDKKMILDFPMNKNCASKSYNDTSQCDGAIFDLWNATMVKKYLDKDRSYIVRNNIDEFEVTTDGKIRSLLSGKCIMAYNDVYQDPSDPLEGSTINQYNCNEKDISMKYASLNIQCMKWLLIPNNVAASADRSVRIVCQSNNQYCITAYSNTVGDDGKYGFDVKLSKCDTFVDTLNSITSAQSFYKCVAPGDCNPALLPLLSIYPKPDTNGNSYLSTMDKDKDDLSKSFKLLYFFFDNISHGGSKIFSPYSLEVSPYSEWRTEGMSENCSSSTDRGVRQFCDGLPIDLWDASTVEKYTGDDIIISRSVIDVFTIDNDGKIQSSLSKKCIMAFNNANVSDPLEGSSISQYSCNYDEIASMTVKNIQCKEWTLTPNSRGFVRITCKSNPQYCISVRSFSWSVQISFGFNVELSKCDINKENTLTSQIFLKCEEAGSSLCSGVQLNNPYPLVPGNGNDLSLISYYLSVTFLALGTMWIIFISLDVYIYQYKYNPRDARLHIPIGLLLGMNDTINDLMAAYVFGFVYQDISPLWCMCYWGTIIIPYVSNMYLVLQLFRNELWLSNNTDFQSWFNKHSFVFPVLLVISVQARGFEGLRLFESNIMNKSIFQAPFSGFVKSNVNDKILENVRINLFLEDIPQLCIQALFLCLKTETVQKYKTTWMTYIQMTSAAFMLSASLIRHLLIVWPYHASLVSSHPAKHSTHANYIYMQYSSEPIDDS